MSDAIQPLPIVQAGDPVLRLSAATLSVERIRSLAIQDLIEVMRETMRAAPGVGLAAPQIGQSLRLAVIEDRAEYQQALPPEELREKARAPIPFHVLINPRIVERSAEHVLFYEGCLSLTGFSAEVPRALGVRVECLDEHGQTRIIDASGWYARILQHEIDHLDGNLYIDRMNSRTFTTRENWLRFGQGDGSGTAEAD